MRDLASRLRDIVRQNPPPDPSSRPARELTYVPDLDGNLGGHEPDRAAAALGGAVHQCDVGTCVRVDRTWDGDCVHGRHLVESMRPSGTAPISLFDARLSGATNWAERVVFFDIETTGLSGGAGTLAFLVGCGWFEGEQFRVRQFFLNGPAGERAMLDALGAIFERASLVVTYNGRTFDVPTMETRWAFHRMPSPTDDMPHFDMLPTARRLWGNPGAQSEGGGCSLGALERSLLGFHRIGDVPGFEIPARYFHFLRTGDLEAVAGVLEHNRLDIISLAGVTARALEMAEVGPHACRNGREQIGLGRLYERVDDGERAAEAYQLAASCDERETRVVAWSRLAELRRRAGRHEEAAQAWQQVLDQGIQEGRHGLSRLERRAAEGLAIHLEHRVKNPVEAKRYAELLSRASAERQRAEVDHRLGRLDRKMKSTADAKGGPSAAPLSFE